MYVGDSGELISAAWTLGIPHPPGYPLFCLLGKLFSFLPIASIAFRVNLTAVFFGALTMVFVYRVFCLLTLGRKKDQFDEENLYIFLAVASTLFFAFTTAFWSQTGMAKGALYVINVFFLALLLYLLLLWRHESQKKYLYLTAFVYGLCLTNHHTSLAYFPAILAFIWFYDKKELKDLKIWPLFILGLSVYLYLPVRAATSPAMNVGNPSDLHGMLQHILRKQYGSLSKITHSVSLFAEQVKYTGILIIRQFPLHILILPLLGLIYLFSVSKRFFVVTLIVFFAITGGAILGLNFDINQAKLEVANLFFMPVYLIIAVWMFCGIIFFTELFKIKMLKSAFSVLLVLFLVISFLQGFELCNKNENYLALNYGKINLNSCAKDAVLFISEDSPIYQIAYLKIVEGARPDITVCDETGTAFRTLSRGDQGIVFKNVLEERLKEYFAEALRTGRPLYCTIESSTLGFTKSLNPSGLLYRLNGIDDNEKFWRNLKVSEETPRLDIFNRDMIARCNIFYGEYLYSAGKKMEALACFSKAGNVGRDMDWIHYELSGVYARHGMKQESLGAAEMAAKLFPYSVERRNNLGTFYLSLNRQEDAIREFKAAAEISPDSPAPHHNLALIYQAQNKKEEAIAEYTKAALLGQPESYKSLANIYMNDNNLDKALVIYTDYVKKYPSDLDAYNAIGLICEKQGKQDQALGIYRSLIAANPNYVFAYINIGNIYFKQKDYENALKSYEDGARFSKDPNITCEAVFNTGVVYYHTGKFDLARKQWEETLKINPNHSGARNALKALR